MTSIRLTCADVLRTFLVAGGIAAGVSLGLTTSASAQEHGAHEDGAHADDHASQDAGSHGAAHGHEESIDTFRLGGSFVNFAIWLGLMVMLLRKPLSQFLQTRRAAVVDGMEEAKRLKDDAEAKYKEYSERIENLDAELERLREEMRRAGQAERERVVADAAAKAEKMRAEARFLIEQQMKQLREDLTREAIEAAVTAAGTLLAKQTSAEDQTRLAQAYLGTLRESLKQKVEEKRL